MALEKWQVNTLKLLGSATALILTTLCPQLSAPIAIGGQLLLTPEVIKSLEPFLGMIGSVAAGNVANAIESFVPEGKVNQQVSLANEHLTRVVGRAIAAVLAEEIKKSPTGTDKRQLQAMGLQAENYWLSIAKEILPQANLPQDDLQQNNPFRALMEQNLPDVITPTATNLVQETCLDEDSWKEICQKLNQKAGSRTPIPPQTLEVIAKALYEGFPKALREALKQDFVKDGEAYAGLTLSLMIEMKAKLQGLEASQQQNFHSTFERFDKIEEYLKGSQNNQKRIFGILSNQIKSGFAELTELLESLKKAIEAKQDEVLEAQKQFQQTLESVEVTTTQVATGQREIQKMLLAEKLPFKVISALLNFDYQDQVSSFENFVNGDSPIGACLIHGEENSGQPWLLYRLLHTHPYVGTDSVIKKIDIVQLTQSGNLSSKICQQLGIKGNPTIEDIFKKIVARLETGSIIFIAKDIHQSSNESIKQFLQEFWQKFVSFYQQNPHKNDETRLLFFLIDLEGKSREWHISFCDDVNQQDWDSYKLLRLQRIEGLAGKDLKRWLNKFKKDLLNQQISEDICRQVMNCSLLQSQEIINHQSVLEHICHCYNIPLGEIEKKWKTYY